jgi:tetratricopeptide (TPR) repeat protein
MSVVIQFPPEFQSKVLPQVQAVYTAREISRQFGLRESSIRRWTRKGIIQTTSPGLDGEPRYDFKALIQCRRVRDLKKRGLTHRQIEADLHGQLSLFSEKGGRLVQLPIKLSSFEEALLLHERKDKKASEMYQRAIQQGENVADAYCNLGILAYENNTIHEAFDHFTNSLKADPRHFESHFNLAHFYFEAGDSRLARLHYELSAIIDPHSSSAHFNIGLICAIEGDIDTAIISLNKAKECATEEELSQVDELIAGLLSTAKTK